MKKSITFLAGLCLAFSLNLKAADVIIDPTASLATTYSGATEGDVIILADGDYIVDGSINITKGITIKAQNNHMAKVIGAGFIFNTILTSDFKLQGLVIDGTKSTDSSLQSYLTDINGGTSLNNVSIENCRISNYGNCILRANRAEGVLNEFKVNNCIFKTIGAVQAYPFFQMTKTRVTRLELTNSTIADLSNEYIQFYGTVAGNDNAVILFKNNTFYNTVTNTARKPMGGKSGKLYIQNNIFQKSPVHVSEIAFDLAVTTAELTNNVIFDYADGAFMNAAGWLVNSGNSSVDPAFSDVANYNFTLPTGSALISSNIGDPRWFGTTEVNNPQLARMKVFPNPTSDLLNFNHSFIKVEVMNLLGKTLKIAQDNSSISVKSLVNGCYIIRITDENGEISIQKFTKK